MHVHGIGYATERKLWADGITTWDEFFSMKSGLDLRPHFIKRLEEGLSTSIDHLSEANHRFFRRQLPTRESWRAYEEFRDSVAFLDIETTGLETESGEITVIGLYDGARMSSYLEDDLERFPRDLEQYKLIVTFNGSSFDLPFIRRTFPELRLHQIHIDLRHVLRRLGLRGGLKAIERQVGIERTPATREVRGWDAVYLWRRYLKGDEEALNVLLQYNKEDVVNLKALVEMAYDGLRALCLHHGFRTYSMADIQGAIQRPQ